MRTRELMDGWSLAGQGLRTLRRVQQPSTATSMRKGTPSCRQLPSELGLWVGESAVPTVRDEEAARGDTHD